MSLVSSLIGWFVGSVFLWGLWLAYTLDPQHHINAILWGCITSFFAVVDLIGLYQAVIKKAIH